MKDTKLLYQVVRMLWERADYFDKHDEYERACAYMIAHDILLYALDGNKEMLDQFDYYHEEDK